MKNAGVRNFEGAKIRTLYRSPMTLTLAKVAKTATSISARKAHSRRRNTFRIKLRYFKWRRDTENLFFYSMQIFQDFKV